MTTPVKQENPTMLQRIGYTLSPMNARTVDFVVELTKGNNIHEAAKNVKETGKAVREANIQTFKQNVHETNKDLVKMGGWKYLVAGPVTIFTIDYLDKKFNEE